MKANCDPSITLSAKGTHLIDKMSFEEKQYLNDL